MLHVVVDGANVVGSRPNGWWHDRAGAARRLAGQLVAALVEGADTLVAALAGPAGSTLRVHLVLEGAAARAQDLPTHPQLDVVLAPADGDSMIATLVSDLGSDPDGDVVVVTADRELRARVRAAGATTTGPSTLLRALPPPP